MSKNKENRRPYRTWTEDDMSDALKDIKNGLSLGRAMKKYGIPKQTLSDGKNNTWKTTTLGTPNELSAVEESALIHYVKYMASIAYPLGVPKIKIFAWSLSRRKQESRFNDDLN